jgi:hypothetical protein
MDEQQTPEPVKNWLEGFDERTRKHIRFARHYQAHFSHGAPGHLDLETIATLARYVDFLTDQDTSDEAQP